MLLVPYQSRLLARLQRKLPAALSGAVSAEDLLQDTFVEVFRQIRRFRPQGRGAFVRWLLMVADGRLIHAIRLHTAAKRGGGLAGISTESDSTAGDLLEMLSVDSHSPSRSFARSEAEARVAEALAKLREEYREAVRLRFLDGLSVAEIAVRLGRTEWSIHKLCNRGLRRLRDELGDAGRFLSRK